MDHEYKAATVLAGSVVEALLLWALTEKIGEPTVLSMTKSAKPLTDWTLGPLIEAASSCPTFRTSPEAFRGNFRGSRRRNYGSRGCSASIKRSVCNSQSRSSFFSWRWLAMARRSCSACSALTQRCVSLPPRILPHS